MTTPLFAAGKDPLFVGDPKARARRSKRGSSATMVVGCSATLLILSLFLLVLCVVGAVRLAR